MRSRTITHYLLSAQAEADLGTIFDYTEKEFGKAQASRYLMALDAIFNDLIINPKSGRERREIRANLRSIIHSSHIIFYRVCTDHIRIVRVLHAGRDLSRFL